MLIVCSGVQYKLLNLFVHLLANCSPRNIRLFAFAGSEGESGHGRNDSARVEGEWPEFGRVVDIGAGEGATVAEAELVAESTGRRQTGTR